jgi:hypothetical protein
MADFGVILKHAGETSRWEYIRKVVDFSYKEFKKAVKDLREVKKNGQSEDLVKTPVSLEFTSKDLSDIADRQERRLADRDALDELHELQHLQEMEYMRDLHEDAFNMYDDKFTHLGYFDTTFEAVVRQKGELYTKVSNLVWDKVRFLEEIGCPVELCPADEDEFPWMDSIINLTVEDVFPEE